MQAITIISILIRKLHIISVTFILGILLFQMNTREAFPMDMTGVPDTLVLGGITFVRIPGGSFAMGDNSSHALENEQPVHRVTISSFWIASTEITFMQWKAFLDQANYPQGRSKAVSGNHPVVSVSWEDTQAFCRWFSKEYGVTMRLPTEAEWEYAARGGIEGQRYPNGNSVSHGDSNYDSGGSVTVAQYPANGYGLYDMAGNVFEWTGDWYDKTYYQVSPGIDPEGPETEEGKLQRHADRGGGWCMGVEMVRVSARHPGPGSWDEGGTADCLGFRPVIEGIVQDK